MYRLFWVFRNHHQWEQVFPDYETMVGYINTCGLMSHPDIRTIVYKDAKGLHHTLKHGAVEIEERKYYALHADI